MAGLKYIVPALAVAVSSVAAQCGNGGTTTIQSNADATALASCQTYSGSIAIATGTTDNIQLDGLQSVSGSLIAQDVVGMTALGATNLRSIGDSFTLDGLTILSTLSFPSLQMVDTIFWNALPALQTLSFTRGVNDVSMVTIQNTYLNSLEGLNLETVDTFVAVNNDYLNEIEMKLKNVGNAITIADNGKQLEVSFPNMIWAHNMTIRNASSIEIPSLESVNGSLGFYSDASQTIEAANLTKVGQSLSFVSCEDLTNISMPLLTNIGGGFQIANNTALMSINGFPALQTVGGAADFRGDFENVTLPELSDVRGAFSLVSSANINETCSDFQKLTSNPKVIKGKFNCKGQTNPLAPGSGTSTGSDSSTSSSAAYPMLIPGATGLLGVVAAVFGLL